MRPLKPSSDLKNYCEAIPALYNLWSGVGEWSHGVESWNDMLE